MLIMFLFFILSVQDYLLAGIQKQVKKLQWFNIDIKLLKRENLLENYVHLFAVATYMRKVVSLLEIFEEFQEN